MPLTLFLFLFLVLLARGLAWCARPVTLLAGAGATLATVVEMMSSRVVAATSLDTQSR